MNRKYVISFLSVSAILLTLPNIAIAQVSPTALRGTIKRELKMNTTTGSAALTTIQQKGDTLITQRLTSLNTMLTRVGGLTRLTADEKTALTTNINNNITGLTSLKAKIDADTDADTVLADVKSILGTYRVYAEFDPQTNMLATSDTLSKAIDELTQLATKLQTRINEAAANGNSVTSLKTLLTDMQNKIADAKTQQTTVQNNIATLSPSTYNSDPTGVRTTFTTSRTALKTARTDLQTAIQDAKQIILGIKVFKTTTTATPGANTNALTPTSTM